VNATDQGIDRLAQRLSAIADELGLAELGHAITRDTVRRVEHNVVRVLVLGEIKQGKSSLINALLGRDALPMGVTPTTGATVVVRSGEPTGMWAIADDGIATVLDRETFVARAKGVRSGEDAPIERLELQVEPGVLPQGLELLDTPGINDIANWRATISRGELPSADALILVLDATQLLNHTELAFLRDALAAVGGLRDSGARLLLAINRIDLIGEEDRPLLRKYLARELAALTGAIEPRDVFETEARGALREPDEDRHGIRELKRLRGALDELAGARHQMLPLRARASLRRYAALLQHNAGIAGHALGLEQEALRREIRTLEREWAEQELDMTAVRSQMTAARERVLAASEDRLVAFRAHLQTSTIAAIGTASQRVLASFLPGALHDAYLGFAGQETERLRAELDELTRQAIHTHSEEVRRRLFAAAMRLGFRGPTIYLDPPSVALEAGLVAIGLIGTGVMYFGNVIAGMLMTIAGPLATVVLRERSLRDARARARVELPGALDLASSALREAVIKVVEGHVAALDEHLVLANRGIGEQLASVLRRAQSVLTVDDAPSTIELVAGRRSRAQARLHELEHELAAIEHVLAVGESSSDAAQ
jgi:small GTP-binding protein